MDLMQLTEYGMHVGGRPVYINPQQVALLREQTKGNGSVVTQITLAGGAGSVTVQHPVDHVLEVMGRATDG